ncbi:hypothetical protein EJ02DRAFT_257943 [Clathrospora elynae]|uniref:Uncharacterized protein n=1 Tax=Clathrospora elynae TaxID=706981 RepID=A0A6A5SI93_9PLEO|nr:hypothetical protein EJ02DRAFT_257943 [Clathrospora elynae]
MGKAKQCMRSLRFRLNPSKSNANDKIIDSKASISALPPLSTTVQGISTTTLQTQANSRDEAQTPLMPPSMSSPVSMCRETVAPGPKSAINSSREEADASKEYGDVQRISLDARTTLGVNIAIFNFAKKLPLEQLSMIGRGSVLSVSEDTTILGEGGRGRRDYKARLHATSSTLSLTRKRSDSSWSFACRSARRIEREERGAGVYQDTEPELPSASRTLSLANVTKTGPSWSFTCRSARPIERNKARLGESSDASSFGSLAGWGMKHGNSRCGEKDDSDQKESIHSLASTIIVYDVDHPQRNILYRPVRLSDEEFDALPDWSDVEDDPEYNDVEKKCFRWSTTASSCSSKASMEQPQLMFPVVYVPSNYSGISTTGVHNSDTATKKSRERKQNETEETGCATKKRRISVVRKRRRLTQLGLGRYSYGCFA